MTYLSCLRTVFFLWCPGIEPQIFNILLASFTKEKDTILLARPKKIKDIKSKKLIVFLWWCFLQLFWIFPSPF